MNTTLTGDLPLSLVQQSLGSVVLPAEELRQLVDALSRRWRSVLRCRREVVPQKLPLPTRPVPWYRPARRLIEEGENVFPSRYLAYAAGDYYLQDAGSLLALAAAGADGSALTGKLICDLCAAPGGKASALVEAIGDEGFVLANEPIRSRVAALQLNLARTGSDRFAISCLDPQALADRVGSVFDVVLVDAPCSGQVLMSRGRQTASSWSMKQVQHSASRQRRILDAATRLLRSGGQLIYSTCTFAAAENEAQVARLISNGLVEAREVDRLRKYQSSASACYRLWPQRHDCAGSFAASLVARDSDSAADAVENQDFRQSKEQRQPKRLRGEAPDLSQWFGSLGDSTRTRVVDSVVLGWPCDAPPWVDALATAGPELAHRTGQTWKPAHAAALRRVDRATSLRSIEIDADLARRFVRGETIPCDTAGWQVVKLDGRPLGWVKASRSTGKNHLPASARMTSEILG